LLRTVIALDPAHVTLLVVIATPHDLNTRPRGEDHWHTVDREELLGRWGGGKALLDAALAVLEREGLIAGVGEYTSVTVPRWWKLGPYGELLFRFLERSGEAQSSG
jgi:hypothetical protein